VVFPTPPFWLVMAIIKPYPPRLGLSGVQVNLLKNKNQEEIEKRNKNSREKSQPLARLMKCQCRHADIYLYY
jgi:hypothetical protein